MALFALKAFWKHFSQTFSDKGWEGELAKLPLPHHTAFACVEKREKGPSTCLSGVSGGSMAGPLSPSVLDICTPIQVQVCMGVTVNLQTADLNGSFNCSFIIRKMWLTPRVGLGMCAFIRPKTIVGLSPLQRVGAPVCFGESR